MNDAFLAARYPEATGAEAEIREPFESAAARGDGPATIPVALRAGQWSTHEAKALHRVPATRGSMSDREHLEEQGIKVTDRRMFSATGELREEFRDLEEAPPPNPNERREAEEKRPLSEESTAQRSGPSRRPEHVGEAPPSVAAPPPPGYPVNGAPPEFLDIVSMLVESAAVFLGDARIPGVEAQEDLERAQYHIDLLGVLQERTAGRLSAQEDAVLADILYRLRMRYVQKRR